ncbi:MAG: energy transducer TonB [Blastocatellia bacterium]
MAAESLSFSIPKQDNLITNLMRGLALFFGNLGKSPRALKPGEAGSDFLLSEEKLSSRLFREFNQSVTDFRANPKLFIQETMKGDGTSKKRHRLMQVGLALGMITYAVLFTTLILSALIRARSTLNVSVADFENKIVAADVTLTQQGGDNYTAKLKIDDKGIASFERLIPGQYRISISSENCSPEERTIYVGKGINDEGFQICPPDVTMLEAPKLDIKTREKEPQIGGSKKQPQQARGGGGGGAETKAPPSKGVPPKMSLTPPIIPPSVSPPKIKNPTLVVAPTILGDPNALPDLKGPLGDPKGVEGPPAPGSGKGGGIGSGSGGGVGEGDGGGLGRGRGGNVGGGDNNIGGGGTGLVPLSQVSTRPVPLLMVKGRYTEEARQNKIQGVVTLSVIVTADGGVTGIRVVRGLPDGLTESAIEAAKKSRFKPATKSGEPVATRMNLEFSFNIY